MWVGVLAALGAGLLWGLVFLVPLVLGDYPGVVLAFGRYTAFGILALGLAWVDRAALAKLSRADWFEAAKLSLIGNILYYAALASAIQLAGAPMPTLIIGTLPVVIAVTANLLDRRAGRVEQALEWRRLVWPLLLIVVGLMVVQLGPTHAGEVPASTVVDYAAGLGLAVLAVVCWTWYPIRNSRWLKARPPGMSRAWATAQGLATLPLALSTGAAYAVWAAVAGRGDTAFAWPLGPEPALFFGLMLVTGLAASWLGTLLWNKASHLLPAALLGQLIVFETLAALLYAFFWYARLPAAHEIVGIALLVFGVLLGVRLFRERPG